MNAKLARLIVFIVLVVAAGLIQNTNAFNIDGIKPNLSLVILITLVPLAASFYQYLVLVLVSGIMLRFETGWEISLLIFLIIALAAYWASRHLPWISYINHLFLIFLATAVFYLLAAPVFLYQNWDIVLGEVVYNLIAGGVLAMVLFPDLKRNA